MDVVKGDMRVFGVVKSLYYYVSIFLPGFRMGVRVKVRVRVSVSQWDSE